jgi:malate/lactate dehydrogenase
MIGGKRQNILKHHVMDLSSAVSGQDVLVRAGTYNDIGGSQIVINAAGLHVNGKDGRSAMLQGNLVLMRDIALKIKNQCPDAVVITATNPVGPLNYATYLAGDFDRRKVIGYSLNDSFRLRELIAQNFNVKTGQVEGVVIGEHGPTQVQLFSSVRIDGVPVDINEGTKQRIKDKASKIIAQFESFQAGRTAGWTCAVGLAAFIKAIVNDSGEMLPCSLVLDGEYGQKRLSMSVPARIGRQGVLDILELPLAPDEERALKVSVDKLSSEMRSVEEGLRKAV